MKTITKQFLQNNPGVVFVFGDNLKRRGKAGAALLRDEPNVYGFITKKYPSNSDSSFYHPAEYKKVFDDEMVKLIRMIKQNSNKTFYISPIGSKLANRYNIYSNVIEPGLKQLEKYDNVVIM
jgi:hypothetical protein